MVLTSKRSAILGSLACLGLLAIALVGCKNPITEQAKSLQAEAASPRIVLSRPDSSVLESGGTFDFGALTSVTFTVANTGKTELAIDLTGIKWSWGLGTTGADFSYDPPPATIATGSSATFTLHFNTPNADIGAKAAVLSIPTNDVANAALIINVKGRHIFADLSALNLSAGTLTPAFSSGITDYSASVSNAVNSITLSATKADVSSTVSFNPSQPAILSEGMNVITATVNAIGGAVRTYTVTVTRAPSAPALAITGTGITRTITITPPASCPSSTTYYAANGVDVTVPGNRVSYTVPLTVTGNGVKVAIQAVAVVNGVCSTVASDTTSMIAYPDLGLTNTVNTAGLPSTVYAAVAVNGTTVYYSDDHGSIKKLDISSGNSTVLAGAASATDLDGVGTAARFNSISDITTDGINLYVLTMNKVRKVDLSTLNVTTIASSSLPSWASNGNMLSSVTDGSYVFIQTYIASNSYIGKVRISDGYYTDIGSCYLAGGYFSGLAWDGTTLFCSITQGNAMLQGYLQEFNSTGTTTYSGAVPGYYGSRGITVTSGAIYMGHASSDAVHFNGPVTKQTIGGISIIATRSSNYYHRKMFTDGVWLYGYGSSNVNGSYGALYILK